MMDVSTHEDDHLERSKELASTVASSSGAAHTGHDLSHNSDLQNVSKAASVAAAAAAAAVAFPALPFTMSASHHFLAAHFGRYGLLPPTAPPLAHRTTPGGPSLTPPPERKTNININNKDIFRPYCLQDRTVNIKSEPVSTSSPASSP